jgi:hypothetical protein
MTSIAEVGPQITRATITSAVAGLPVVTHGYGATLERHHAAQVDTDVDTVLECAAAWHLDDVHLTADQHLALQQIFPRQPWWRAQDLRPHHQFENGVQVDGEALPECCAVESLTAARSMARRLVLNARDITAAVAG